MGPAKTIGIDLWAGQVRAGQNVATCYRQVSRQALTRTMRDLFLGAAATRMATSGGKRIQPAAAARATEVSAGAFGARCSLRDAS